MVPVFSSPGSWISSFGFIKILSVGLTISSLGGVCSFGFEIRFINDENSSSLVDAIPKRSSVAIPNIKTKEQLWKLSVLNWRWLTPRKNQNALLPVSIGSPSASATGNAFQNLPIMPSTSVRPLHSWSSSRSFTHRSIIVPKWYLHPGNRLTRGERSFIIED